MKKVWFFIILVGLLISNSVLAQELKNCMWQLQNPFIMTSSEIVTFTNQKFCYSMIDLSTQKISLITGTYKVLNNNLTLTFKNGQIFKFKITQITANQIMLSDDNTDQDLIYAKTGSDEDQFKQNYSTWCKLNNVKNYPPNYANPDNNYEVCQTCEGNGTCKVCRGNGIEVYSMCGFLSNCLACYGSGKCWHCYGSGRQ